MVQIIEDEQDAGGAECIRFRPYRSKRAPGEIVARWQLSQRLPEPKGAVQMTRDALDTPLRIKFMGAVELAHHDGIPLIWIDDPNHLFLPPNRPTF